MKYPLLMASLLFTVACSASNGEKMNDSLVVTVLAADRFCGNKEGISIITSADSTDLQPMVVSQAIANSKLDWNRLQILRINMGQQPNLGYSLDYKGGAEVINGRLRIPVQWNSPQSGRMYAQMLVAPCLLLSIPRQGYETIEVIDQDGRLRGFL